MKSRNITVGADVGFGPFAGQIRLSAECDSDVTAIVVAAVDWPGFDLLDHAALASSPLGQVVVSMHLERCSVCSKLGDGRLIAKHVDPAAN